MGITHESVALYALGGLDEGDGPAFEAHLASCERCRADLETFVAAIAALAAEVEPVEPPPSLRGRILEESRRQPPDGRRRRRAGRA